jgi:hypothetical protein
LLRYVILRHHTKQAASSGTGFPQLPSLQSMQSKKQEKKAKEKEQRKKLQKSGDKNLKATGN